MQLSCKEKYAWFILQTISSTVLWYPLSHKRKAAVALPLLIVTQHQ